MSLPCHLWSLPTSISTMILFSPLLFPWGESVTFPPGGKNIFGTARLTLYGFPDFTDVDIQCAVAGKGILPDFFKQLLLGNHPVLLLQFTGNLFHPYP